MNRRYWLSRVASHAAANLGASDSGEVVFEYDDLSAADRDRVDWAIDAVQSRLYRIVLDPP